VGAIPGEVFFMTSGLGFLAVVTFAFMRGGIDREKG
jgi:hypothetical protein